MDEIFQYIMDHRLMEKNDLYNVNIPDDPVGFRITRQGGPYYSDDFESMENDMKMPRGKDVFIPSNTMDLDTDAVLVHHLISISPLTIDRTNLAVYAQLQQLNG